MFWSRGSTVIVYVPVTGSVNMSRKPVGPETNRPADERAVRLADGQVDAAIVFADTDSVSFWPAVAVNERTRSRRPSRSSPSSACRSPSCRCCPAPVRAGRSALPVSWSRGSTVIVYVPVDRQREHSRKPSGRRGTGWRRPSPFGWRTVRSTAAIVFPDSHRHLLAGGRRERAHGVLARRADRHGRGLADRRRAGVVRDAERRLLRGGRARGELRVARDPDVDGAGVEHRGHDHAEQPALRRRGGADAGGRPAGVPARRGTSGP